ncbi:hypothetical protein FA13DRAFT_1632472 [Coprinellus micaceus]|uniref:Uncharacterized protein n=1 Tax=Coprinellus micaceus TaxID=71717 RepID=A0A4Y7T4Q8_COPMI|nr:hypothetical protein FA13DRAFT_1632472 [Coprinellus micaceus]
MAGKNKENQHPSGTAARKRQRDEDSDPNGTAARKRQRDEDSDPSGTAARKRQRDEDSDPEETALSLGPRKKGAKQDSLVHHGRHFGRTVRTFTNFHVLLREGVLREEQMSINEAEIEELDEMDQREQKIFRQLMKICPFLSDRLFSLKRVDEDITHAADLLTKGASGARSDDIKSLKSAVIDWITPAGGVLSPAIQRNVKTGRGFFHDMTGKYLCPTDYDWNDATIREQLKSKQLVVTGLQWPMFLYANLKCDEEKMWDGLLRSKILVQAYKHIFTSPSSVDGGSRATRSGNAQIHGMKTVTVPSLAYIATLVRFSLSEHNTFCRNDPQADSERFYNGLIDFLEEEEEKQQVSELLEWWNK